MLQCQLHLYKHFKMTDCHEVQDDILIIDLQNRQNLISKMVKYWRSCSLLIECIISHLMTALTALLARAMKSD